MNLTRGINLRKIAEKMTGSSGAEVKVINTLIIKINVVVFIDSYFHYFKISIGCLHRSRHVCTS
jgi:hypothetical protein